MSFTAESLCKNLTRIIRGALPIDPADADTLAAEARITDALIALYEKQDGKCARTGIDLYNDYSKKSWVNRITVEPVDPSLPYSLDNLRFVCRMAPETFTRSDANRRTFEKWCIRYLRERGYTVTAPQGVVHPLV